MYPAAETVSEHTFVVPIRPFAGVGFGLVSLVLAEKQVEGVLGALTWRDEDPLDQRRVDDLCIVCGSAPRDMGWAWRDALPGPMRRGAEDLTSSTPFSVNGTSVVPVCACEDQQASRA